MNLNRFFGEFQNFYFGRKERHEPPLMAEGDICELCVTIWEFHLIETIFLMQTALFY